MIIPDELLVELDEVFSSDLVKTLGRPELMYHLQGNLEVVDYIRRKQQEIKDSTLESGQVSITTDDGEHNPVEPRIMGENVKNAKFLDDS